MSYKKDKELINGFLGCSSNQEVSDLRDTNIDYLKNHEELYVCIINARRRIAKIRKSVKRGKKF
jgi:hypothetical protein